MNVDVHGRPDSKFYRRTSVLTSLLHGGQLSWSSIGMKVKKSYVTVDNDQSRG
jgi:hypothetical protein